MEAVFSLGEYLAERDVRRAREHQRTVQVVPLSVKAAGAGLVPVQLPRNPIDCDPPAAMESFHDALVTVTAAPLCETDPFHSCEIVCPPVNDHPTFHELIAAAPILATFTSPWKPPCQLPVTR